MLSSADPIEAWHALVRQGTDANLCAGLAARMRERHLTFGGRLVCPFLRPFFFEPADAGRIKGAAETLWRLGERLARAGSPPPPPIADTRRAVARMRLGPVQP